MIPHDLPPAIRKGFNRTEAIFDRPVFITGMGRSGTTLLLRLLDGHPEIFTVPQESRILTHILPAHRAGEDIAAIAETLRLRVLKMARDRDSMRPIADWLTAAMPARLTDDDRSARGLFRDLLAALAVEQGTAGKRLWLEKTPKNELHLDEIFANFPKAKIVFNIRDPRAVHASIVKEPRSLDTDPRATARVWKTRLKAFLDFLVRNPHRRERFHVTRYEDFVARPETVFPKLLAFMGIDQGFEPKPTLFGAAWSGNSHDPSTNTPGRLDPAKIDSWRKQLPASAAQTIARDAALEMTLLGYAD